MQPLQICIGPTIRIGRESWCLPYAGFLLYTMITKKVSGLRSLTLLLEGLEKLIKTSKSLIIHFHEQPAKPQP